MRGTIIQRGKETYLIQISQGFKDGKYRRYTETIHCKKKSDAEKRLRELLVDNERGSTLPTGCMKVSEHFRRWLDGYVKTNCSIRTQEGYETILEKHLEPAFGHIILKKLQPSMIQTYYGNACKTLSARTVHHQHRVLSESFKYAVRQGYLGRNPCDMVDPPRPVDRIMRTLNPSEVEMLLKGAQNSRQYSQYYPVTYTAVSSGLRQAELLGLRWRDVDLDLMGISVNQVLYWRKGIVAFKEPKTKHSRRLVRMTPNLAIFLREYKGDMESMYLTQGKLLSLDDLVFSKEDGSPFNPAVMSHDYERLVKRIGLKGVRFHDLRHTFASLCLMRGVSPKVISEALGHSSVAFTLSVYSHIIEGMQQDAMNLLNDVIPLGGSKNKICNNFASETEVTLNNS